MEGRNIVYRFSSPADPNMRTLYVNVIANYACTNACDFCSKPKEKGQFGRPNIYEQKADASLFLGKPPTVTEVMKAIEGEIKLEDDEVAIIGLGEPLIYLKNVVEIIKELRKKYDKATRIRIDTNGLVKCMFPGLNPATLLKQSGLDEIRISLNAITPEEYDQLCRPKFKNAFKQLVQFTRDCIELDIETYVSFVTEFKESRPEDEYAEFAQSLGISRDHIIFRKYVKPV